MPPATTLAIPHIFLLHCSISQKPRPVPSRQGATVTGNILRPSPATNYAADPPVRRLGLFVTKTL